MAKGSDNSAGRRSSSRNTKPYDANNSFVRKMATKVTDFIQPSWISKWFNTSQSNEDVLDSEENVEEFEDDARQVPQMHLPDAPPSKRSRIRMDVTHPPGTFSIQTRVKSGLNAIDISKEQYPIHEMSEDFLEPATAGPSGIGRFISSTPATQSDVRTVTSQRSDLNSLASPANNGISNGTDDNSESSESTSGCSSLIPQINRHEGPSNLLYSSTFSSRKRHIDDKLTFTNHLQSPRSLFLDSTSRDTLSNRRPSFNASVMTNSLDRASPLSSPFYSGNITFGGANVAGLYKRGRNLFNSSSELQLKVPRRTNVEVKSSTTAGVDSSGMSQTAKKILEALEHFSTPISDAKKIPLKHTSNAASSIISRKRSREQVASPSARVGLRHLTRELTVPTVPDILKLRRRQKLQDTTVAARKIVSARSDPPPQEYRLRTEDGENEKYRGKLKGKSKVNLEQQETVAPVNLPNIPLPITTLPSFNFSLPPPAAHGSGTTTTANKDNPFTFASPIKITDTGKTLQSVNNFTFSNPIDVEDGVNNTSDFSFSSSITETKESSEPTAVTRAATSMPNFVWSASSTAPRLRAKVKSSKEDHVGFAVASELQSGSVMDILCPKSAKSAPIEQSNSKVALAATCTDKILSSDSDNKSTRDTESFWECSECMIRNNSSDKQCIACKIAQPNPDDKAPPAATTSTTEKAPVPKSKPSANDSFGSQFKLSMNQWECTICCVRNKRTDAKCVACSAPKPESNQTIQQIVKPQKPDLMEKFRPVEGSWECSGCLLRNPANVITCPCCNASKPTCLKVNPKKASVVAQSSPQKVNVADAEVAGASVQGASTSPSDIMNKFKPSKDSWECPGCLVRNNGSVTACPCCNTAKPDSDVGASKAEQKTSTNGFGDRFKKPEGAWTCDSCMLQNDAKHTECVACQASKPGTAKSKEPASNTTAMQFKFGVPSNASDLASQPGGFKFGVDKTEQPKSDGASPLNGFKFGSAQPLGSTAQFTFGVPREENKAANEASKTNSVASSSGTTGFLFNVKNEAEKPESARQDQETKQSSFSIAQTEAPTANEKSGTGTVFSTTAGTPLFTFGAQKAPAFGQPVSSVDAQNTSCTIATTDSSRSTAAITTVTAITPAAATTTSINSIPVSATTILPSLPAPKSNVPAAKPIPIFQFGAPSNISTAATNTSTSTTTTCLPAFAQSSFTFSDSKAASQPAAIPAFGQTSSAALPTKLFGVNKLPESQPSKPATSATPTGTVFPIVSSSTSLFNSKESKTTTAFSMDKPSAFTAVSKPSSGFPMADNKIPTFGSSSGENKPSIFGTSETKLPGFNTPAQTANPLPNFGTAPGATSSLFGSSSASAFGSNSTATFGGTATTPTIFSTTKPSETPNAASNPSLFTFGSSSSSSSSQQQQQQQPAGGGFNFSANTNAAGAAAAAKPLFTFGSGASTSQSNNNNNSNVFGSGTFGTNSSAPPTNTANFSFNPVKQETPTAFGSQSAVATPIFGTPQATPQTRATSSFSSTSSSSAGFNFGSTAAAAAPPPPPPSAAASGGFNFGGMPSTSAPTGGFNFNPTSTPTMAFDPNSRPSFNFTKGSAPTSFNAPPQSAAAPRKIKKAFRRCMR